MKLKGGYETTDRRLDRLPEKDPRSRSYAIRSLVAGKPRRSYTWRAGDVLDQDREGACVGMGITGEALAAPVMVRFSDPLAVAFASYRGAQDKDQWPGSAYEGTSVLAGMKEGVERSWWTGYRWSFSIEDLILAVGHEGPAVIGIPWLESMFEPRPSGLLEVSGREAGGHCLLARGVRLRARLAGEGSTPLEVMRLRQSWGRGHGVDGDVYVRLEDLERLLDMDGEAAIPTGRLRPPA